MNTMRYSKDLGNQTIDFVLIKSSRARQIYFKISYEKGLEITVPKSFHLQNLSKLLQEKKDWILDNLKHIAEQRKKHVPFQDGSLISIFGQKKVIRFLKSLALRPKIEEQADTILIYSNGSTTYNKKILQEYLKKKAKSYIPLRTAEISKKMGTSYQKITIKTLKSRWGSCSRAKNLNFNWRLLLKPPEVIDYVIIHELAHTVHLDHSKKFYALVQKFCPEYKKLREALTDEPMMI